MDLPKMVDDSTNKRGPNVWQFDLLRSEQNHDKLQCKSRSNSWSRWSLRRKNRILKPLESSGVQDGTRSGLPRLVLIIIILIHQSFQGYECSSANFYVLRGRALYVERSLGIS